MPEGKIKILCFLNQDNGRDVEIILPLRYFAERYLNCTFTFKTAYDIFAVYRLKPDVVMVPNTVGNIFYAKIAEYALHQNIKVFALTSEGIFRTDGTFNFWGDNIFRRFQQEYVCLWNRSTAEYIKKEVPEIASRVVVTGGVGFDRYRIYRFQNRCSFLAENNKRGYKKIIGYASWGPFGWLHYPEGVKLLQRRHDEESRNWLEEQRQMVFHSLKTLVENNPDILFIVKRHPTETFEHIKNREVLNEIINLQDYDNVVYVREEAVVHDLINVADLWFAFESTTAMEAWLLNKVTGFFYRELNHKNFQRTDFYKGSIKLDSARKAQDVIDEFYKTGKVSEFNSPDKASTRKQILENYIGFTDGMNHIRAGYFLHKTVQQTTPARRKFNWKYFLMYIAMEIGSLFFVKSVFKKLPKFSKTVWIFETRSMKNIGPLYRKYSEYLDQFHSEHQIEKKWKEGNLHAFLYPNQQVSNKINYN